MGMHCTGTLHLACPRCGTDAATRLDDMAFRHDGTWEPSLIVVERFSAVASLPCGHSAAVVIEASDGMGGPDVRVTVDGRRTEASEVRLWFGPGGVPMEPQ